MVEENSVSKDWVPVLSFDVVDYGGEIVGNCDKCGRELVSGQYGITIQGPLTFGQKANFQESVECQCGEKVKVNVLFKTREEAINYGKNNIAK